MVTEIPGPFSEVSAGFSDPMALMKKGMSALNKQEIKINGQSGLLVQIRHILSVGEFLKWILVFSDEKESVIVTATMPKEFENELSEKMKASILTATWDRDEMVARGKDKESGQSMVIYQTILFESQSYYIMLGVISNRQKETYLAAYREIAKSFKRR